MAIDLELSAHIGDLFFRGNRMMFAAEHVMVQPFGLRPSDIDIDFTCTSRPRLVTDILRSCLILPSGQLLDEHHLWDATVGERSSALCMIAAGSSPQNEIPVELRCAMAECSAELEMEIAIKELQGISEAADESDTIRVDLGREEAKIVLRKPRGRDQLEWTAIDHMDTAGAARKILADLIIESGSDFSVDLLSEKQLRRIGRRCIAADPLVDFTLELNCPECGYTNSCRIDLAGISLEVLHRVQRKLIESVHRLASCYKWSESEILAMPHWRRNRYLELVTSG